MAGGGHQVPMTPNIWATAHTAVHRPQGRSAGGLSSPGQWPLVPPFLSHMSSGSISYPQGPGPGDQAQVHPETRSDSVSLQPGTPAEAAVLHREPAPHLQTGVAGESWRPHAVPVPVGRQGTTDSGTDTTGRSRATRLTARGGGPGPGDAASSSASCCGPGVLELDSCVFIFFFLNFY